MKQAAEEFVAKLFSHRLEAGGIPADTPGFYFQCQGDDPQEYPEGFQVRVHTWRHWSDASCEFDVETGNLMRYTIDRFADPPNEVEMTEEEAVRAASEAVELPADAVLTNFYHFEFASKHKLARLEWKRIHQGLRVDGDYLYVSIHPKTRRIVEFARKWRKLKLT